MRLYGLLPRRVWQLGRSARWGINVEYGSFLFPLQLVLDTLTKWLAAICPVFRKVLLVIDNNFSCISPFKFSPHEDCCGENFITGLAEHYNISRTNDLTGNHNGELGWKGIYIGDFWVANHYGFERLLEPQNLSKTDF